MSDTERVKPTNGDAEFRPPAAETRGGFGSGRMSSVGIPMEKSMNFGPSVRRLLRRMGPDVRYLPLVLILAFVGVTLVVLGPKVLGHATDEIVSGLLGSGIDFAALHRILLLAVGLYVTSAILVWLQGFILAGVVQRTMYRLRADVEAKLNRLPLSYIDRHARGDLLSRVTNDIDNISQSLQQSLSQLLTSGLTIIGVTIMMITISPLLSIVALVTIPVSLFTIKRIAKRAQPRFIAQWRHTGMLNAQVEEAFTGHSVVKAFGRQHEVEAQFAATNDDLYQASFGAQFASGVIQPAMMFIGNLNFVAIAVVGGLRVSAGALSLGDIQAFIQYSRQFTQPITQVASMANVLQSGVASLERVFELLDADEQSPDADPAQLVPEPRGRVEFDHVSFSYDPDRELIKDLSLVAEPGSTVAIVGPTGAGKTTLVNLIMRFYELDGGRITLDGVDISQMRRHDLRSEIGMVLQDTWLFGGTIRENIAYGNPNATEGQIVDAARGGLCRPVRAHAPPRLRHAHRRRGRGDQRRREAAADDRPCVPLRPRDPHPRRGDELGRYPHRGADPAGNGEPALEPYELRHRAPTVDDPRRRHDLGHGRRPDRRAGLAHRPARRRWRVREPLQRPVRGRRRRRLGAGLRFASSGAPRFARQSVLRAPQRRTAPLLSLCTRRRSPLRFDRLLLASLDNRCFAHPSGALRRCSRFVLVAAVSPRSLCVARRSRSRCAARRRTRRTGRAPASR